MEPSVSRCSSTGDNFLSPNLYQSNWEKIPEKPGYESCTVYSVNMKLGIEIIRRIGREECCMAICHHLDSETDDDLTPTNIWKLKDCIELPTVMIEIIENFEFAHTIKEKAAVTFAQMEATVTSNYAYAITISRNFQTTPELASNIAIQKFALLKDFLMNMCIIHAAETES